jgi:hypothetical protein
MSNDEQQKADETIRNATENYDVKKYVEAVQAGDEEGAAEGAAKLRQHIGNREQGK